MAGKHYPTSTGELMAWFPTDADCVDYLEWTAVARGLRVPALQPRRRLAAGGWPGLVRRVRRTFVGDRRHDLRPRTHATDGVVHGVLAVAAQKDGVSALSFQRTLEIGSY